MGNQVVFCTGAGGFLGRYILEHYFQQPDCEIYLLEQGRFRDRLRSFLDTANIDAGLRSRIHIVEGDITVAGLGLDSALASDLRDRVTHVIHLAALYNLSAPRDASMRVNVEGTRNVLDFLDGLKRLQRFGYASTFAISGDYVDGVFTEDDYNKGQKFKNFYEETKFLAEGEVRERWNRIPTVIFRPAVVVGHSKTGAIEKIDGPYYVFITIARRLHTIHVDGGNTKCHIVPVDFIADSVYALMNEPGTEGKVYCLGDPSPLRYNDFVDLVCERWGTFKPWLRLPPAILGPILSLPLATRLTGITREVFMYASFPSEHSTTNTQNALGRLGIKCPHVTTYVDAMIRYFREHYRDAAIRRGDWRSGTT